MIDKMKFGISLVRKHKIVFLILLTVYAYLIPMLYWIYFDGSSVMLESHEITKVSNNFYAEKLSFKNEGDDCYASYRSAFENAKTGKTVVMPQENSSDVIVSTSKDISIERTIIVPDEVFGDPYNWNYVLQVSYRCNPIKNNIYNIDTINFGDIYNANSFVKPITADKK